MITENFALVEVRYLKLLAVSAALVVARLLIGQLEHCSLDLVLPRDSLNILHLVFQGYRKILDKVDGAYDRESAIDNEVEVLAQITLLDDARIRKNCLALAQKDEFEEAAEGLLRALQPES